MAIVKKYEFRYKNADGYQKVMIPIRFDTRKNYFFVNEKDFPSDVTGLIGKPQYTADASITVLQRQVEKFKDQYAEAFANLKRKKVILYDVKLEALLRDSLGELDDPEVVDDITNRSKFGFDRNAPETVGIAVGYRLGYEYQVGTKTEWQDEDGKLISRWSRDTEKSMEWTAERQAWFDGLKAKLTVIVRQAHKFFSQDHEALVAGLDAGKGPLLLPKPEDKS